MNDVYQEKQSGDQLEIFLRPKIYSKRAIWGFSIFFTPLFGGLLLTQNLKDIDKKRQANLVLIVSTLMTILAIVLIIVFDIKKQIY
jgi:hypothetical protein